MENKKRFQYQSVSDITTSIESLIKETDTVLDIGCGIVPINYFRPKLHIMVEPFEEYRNILLHRHGNDKSVIVLKCGALEALQQFGDASVDSIFLLDVIEHLEKEIGVAVIAELERVAREQVVIFTPLGFMPQHMELGEKDGWGLSGIEMQEHRSGWTPEDFSDAWEFHICDEYHTQNFRGEALGKTYGAFYAVLDPNHTPAESSLALSDIRRPLPSERELERVTNELNETRTKVFALQHELHIRESAVNDLKTRLELLEDQLRAVKRSKTELESLIVVRAYRRFKRLAGSAS